MANTAPRAFICHAGEDNDFATHLGERLRASGVDAFVDEWEILPGDKLIQRIFGEGIPDAKAFIIVLSENSVAKPWVQEELDAALVLRIERRMKVIPIRIDDVEVPVPLKATAWLDMNPSRDFEGEFKKLLQAIYGIRQKPPIGPRPEYAREPASTGYDPVEEAVLRVIVQKQNDRGLDQIEATEIHDALPEISVEQINDAVEILDHDGVVKVHKFLGTAPFNFGSVELTSLGFFNYAPKFLGIDTKSDCDMVLAQVVSWTRGN